jgi:two-component system alkaline phosphatase synthesis response regulator PhoP
MSDAARLLVVEDEAHLAEVISDNLAHEGWQVEVVGDGLAALERIRASRPDLVLLDVMLPGLDGFGVCERLRADGDDTPVLFLTARAGSDDRIRGLALGGDDYLGKPFELDELILRVNAILRRRDWAAKPRDDGDVLTLGDAKVDLARRRVQRGEREHQLTEKEALILRCLADAAGEVVSRADIVDRVWGYDAFPTLRTVDNFIVRLRRLIEPDPKAPRYLHTVRGTGYRLTP